MVNMQQLPLFSLLHVDNSAFFKLPYKWIFLQSDIDFKKG